MQIVKKILPPEKWDNVPIDFIDSKVVYFSFNGIIGKQSKILKKIQERKIKIDIVDGKMVEYRDVFDYPDKPHRTISLNSISAIEKVDRKWFMAKHKFFWQLVQGKSRYVMAADNEG
mmetsp:Transcript_36026/g.35634  ORF Transcript_36026/g.35634 Transcript_36026/m.35634 type:complete len:117 (-) Transcript_36026:1063-1413(-)